MVPLAILRVVFTAGGNEVSATTTSPKMTAEELWMRLMEGIPKEALVRARRQPEAGCPSCGERGRPINALDLQLMKGPVPGLVQCGYCKTLYLVAGMYAKAVGPREIALLRTGVENGIPEILRMRFVDMEDAKTKWG